MGSDQLRATAGPVRRSLLFVRAATAGLLVLASCEQSRIVSTSLIPPSRAGRLEAALRLPKDGTLHLSVSEVAALDGGSLEKVVAKDADQEETSGGVSPPSLEVWVQAAGRPARLAAQLPLVFSRPVEELTIDLAEFSNPEDVLLTVVPVGIDPSRLKWLSAEVVGEIEGFTGRGKRDGGTRSNVSLPDIVLYVVDTLRADHLGCYGASVSTPNFDRLAGEGILFLNALSTSSWTRPSTASLLTGLYPSTHGAQDRLDQLPESAFTLAERLRLIGYSTVAVTANSNIDPVWGFDQGFELFVRPDVPDRDGLGRATRHLHAEEVQDIAIAEWRRRKAARQGPLFLYVHVVDPHGPYDPPEWLLEAPRPESLPKNTNNVQIELNTRRRAATREVISAMDTLYTGEVAYVDRAFGEFVAALDDSSQTLFVLTSDHGEAFHEHGFSSHGMTLFDEELHIPLIFSAPGFLPQGIVIRDRVSLVDIVPTLLGLVGQSTDGLPGIDLKRSSELWQAAGAKARPLIAELDYDGRHWRSLHLESMKLLQNLDAKKNFLFDLDVDQGETSDVISGDEAAAERLLQMLDTEQERMLETRLHVERLTPVEIPESVIDNLRALGYVK